MNDAKVHLSAEEFELVKNAEWILTKNGIIQKVYDLFGLVAERMKKRLELKASFLGMLQSERRCICHSILILVGTLFQHYLAFERKLSKNIYRKISRQQGITGFQWISLIRFNRRMVA